MMIKIAEKIASGHAEVRMDAGVTHVSAGSPVVIADGMQARE